MVAHGGRSRDAMAAAAANKAVFDAVDGDSPITAEQVAVLLRNFARLSNKPRLEAKQEVGIPRSGYPRSGHLVFDE